LTRGESTSGSESFLKGEIRGGKERVQRKGGGALLSLKDSIGEKKI